MATVADKPWRIYVVSADGGKLWEASIGTDNQGAPTWSPDGRWLVYGNVQCQEAGTCAVHKINLATGQEFTVQGSEGLSTARWSPDGRYIAALDSERHEVLAFDSLTERWQKLADGVNGNDLSWSVDSRHIYASRPAGDQPEILRISLKDAKAETAVDLSSFAKLTGRIDTWFTVAPDGSIILLRALNANEIYSLKFEEE
jgi:Tol biopolymer transport system component